MYDFNASNRTARRPKRLETEHGTSDSFHRSMVLLYKVIEILGVTNNDGLLLRRVVVRNRRRIRTTLIDGDLLRESLAANGFA